MKVTSEEWPSVERVLDEVEALAVDQRPLAIARLCSGRPGLRETVERLLDAERACESDGFLEQPAAALAAPLLVPDEPGPAPTAVGPFRIVREVGRGGYGTVYLGERVDVGQRVAVKVLRAGAGRGAQRRFRREQRLLASLDHPSIPRLIDSGIGPSGEAFLAMEFVEGEPITSYVNRKKSGLRERLRLFLQACEAVRYAHAHLVVHRDIKPQNVLVGDGERVPVVKVVDFGIAKPLAPSEDRITVTGPSAPMTLAYAAPEQLRGEPADPATDVYALGLLLFTLLTDRLPYDLAGKSRRDAEAEVLDAEIPRPSGMATAPWARRVRGDLDHVVLKALAKEPARRYPTADALYADVERFLEGVPVSARRPSRLYKAWRIAWRRRAFVLGAAAAIAAAGATYAVGLSRQRAAALHAAEERAVVAEVLADVLGAMEGAPESSPTADAILERATQAIRTRLGPRPRIEAELLVILADQLDELGRWEEAIPVYERAVAIEASLRPGQARHANAQMGLGACLVSERPYPSTANLLRAESLYQQAGNAFASLVGPSSPSSAEVLHLRARIRYVRGDYQAAHRLSTQAVQLLSAALRDSVRWDRAYAAIGLAPQPPLRPTAATNSPSWIRVTLWHALMGLGNAELALGLPIPASRSFRVASHGLRQIRPFEHNTGAAFTNLGDALAQADRNVEAEHAYRVSRSIFQTLYGAQHATVSRATSGIASARLFAGDHAGALRAARAAYRIAEASGDSLALISELYTLSYVQRRVGLTYEAKLGLETALSLMSQAVSMHPDIAGFALYAHAEHSSTLLTLGHIEEAQLEAREAYERADSITRTRALGLTGAAYAEALAAAGDHRQAITILTPRLPSLWEPPMRGNPRLLALRMAEQLAASHSAVGNDSLSRYYQTIAAHYAR